MVGEPAQLAPGQAGETLFLEHPRSLISHVSPQNVGPSWLGGNKKKEKAKGGGRGEGRGKSGEEVAEPLLLRVAGRKFLGAKIFDEGSRGEGVLAAEHGRAAAPQPGASGSGGRRDWGWAKRARLKGFT